MLKYPKIQTLFKRKEPQKGRGSPVIIGNYNRAEFKSIKYWHVSEKLDGTNTRFIITPQHIEIRGRTDKAQFNPDVLAFLNEEIKPKMEKLAEQFRWDDGGDITVIVFGETIGKKINPIYGIDGHDFYAFDIAIIQEEWENGLRVYYRVWWMLPDAIEELLSKAYIKIAPNFGILQTDRIIDMVQEGFYSFITPTVIAEGVVARAHPQMFDRLGNRIMFKLKCRDFERSNATGVMAGCKI